jgi:hypothetical protein
MPPLAAAATHSKGNKKGKAKITTKMTTTGDQKPESATRSQKTSAGLEPCAMNLNALADELPKEKI